MKRKNLFIYFVLCMTIMLYGCGNKADLPQFNEGKFVSLKSTIIGIEEEYKCYTINIELMQDGGGMIYASDFSSDFGVEDCPTRHFELSVDDIEEIKNILIDKDFFSMRKDVGNKDMVYGERKIVTAYTNQGEFATGGLNPSNKDFLQIYDLIYGKVREEVFAYTTELDSMIATQYNAKVQGKNITITDNMQYEIFCANDIQEIFVDDIELHTESDAITDEETQLVICLNDEATDYLDDYTYYCYDEPVVLKLYIKGQFVCQVNVSSRIKDGQIRINESLINDKDIIEIATTLQDILNYK